MTLAFEYCNTYSERDMEESRRKIDSMVCCLDLKVGNFLQQLTHAHIFLLRTYDFSCQQTDLATYKKKVEDLQSRTPLFAFAPTFIQHQPYHIS